MKPGLRVQVYQDAGEAWRWRWRARNGKIIAASGESFFHKANAERASERVLDLAYQHQLDVMFEGTTTGVIHVIGQIENNE